MEKHETKTDAFKRKRISFCFLWMMPLLIFSCMAQEPKQTAYSLGAYAYDFTRLGPDEASQISELKAIGYEGIVMGARNEKKLASLKRYQTAIGNGPFKLYAGMVPVFLDLNLTAQNARIDNVIQALRKSNAKLWIVVRAKDSQKELADHHHISFKRFQEMLDTLNYKEY